MAKVQRASSNERACPKDDINTGEKTNSEQRSCRCQDYRLDPAILYSTPWHLCVRKMWKESTNKDVTSKYKNKSVLGLTDDEATVPHFKATTYYLLSGPPGINTVSDYFSRWSFYLNIPQALEMPQALIFWAVIRTHLSMLVTGFYLCPRPWVTANPAKDMPGDSSHTATFKGSQLRAQTNHRFLWVTVWTPEVDSAFCGPLPFQGWTTTDSFVGMI